MALFVASCWQRFLWFVFTGPIPQPPKQAPEPGSLSDCLVNGLGICLDNAIKRDWFWFAVVVIAAVVFLIVQAFLKGSLQGITEWGHEKFRRFFHWDEIKTTTVYYLKNFAENNQYYKYRAKPAGETQMPTLSTTFLPLKVSLERTRELGTDEKGRPESSEEESGPEGMPLAQALKKWRRLVIIGAPGSGKSTLLQWAGLACVNKFLRTGRLTAEVQEFLLVLGKNTPVPVLVPLRAYDYYCKDGCGHSALSLRDFLVSWYSKKMGKKLPEGFFTLQKNWLWMFDGLDEVDRDNREMVRKAVEEFLALPEYSGCFSLLASRPTAADIAEQLPGFKACYVQRLKAEERDRLIRDWYRAVLHKEPGRAGDMANDLCKKLTNGPEEVRRLATTPLMATIFAVVYFDHDLPKFRAQVYEYAVEALVKETVFKDKEEVPGIEDWGGLPWEIRRDRASQIAFELYVTGRDSILEGDLLDLICKRFENRKKALSFLQSMAARGGLLEREGDYYGFFSHRTFQEYLAGRYLVFEYPAEHRAAFIQHRLNDDHWNEPVVLGAGFLSHVGEGPANQFIQLLSRLGKTNSEQARAFALAGYAISEMLAGRVFQDTCEKVIPPALALFAANPPRVQAAERRRLGLALGAAGDPRLRLCPAPRGLDIQMILPEMAKKPIPAGLYRIGTSEEDLKLLQTQMVQSWPDEQPDHVVRLSEFQIGRYPVTNAEYEFFMKTGGYGDPAETKPEWWSEEGWRWRIGDWQPDLSIYPKERRANILRWLEQRSVERRSEPFFWKNQDWNGRNQPVVGVCWFEAEAYCGWLRTFTGQNYRLPSEAQWEVAARAVLEPSQQADCSPKNRLWPWGNVFDAERCNNYEVNAGFKGTAPVGMYPHGISPCGAEDLVGNVWEWCMDVYYSKEYEQRKASPIPEIDPVNLVPDAARVMRGGSWRYHRSGARCGSRNWMIPDDGVNDVGFRVVLTFIRS